MSPRHTFEELVSLMDRLRGPGGCPWDQEQTYSTLRGYLLEESYEVAEAIDRGEPSALREELGDLLFQIVFLSRLAKEEGKFTVDDILQAIAEKMIRRHPHVFGDARAEDAEQVLRQWEEIKRGEKETAPRDERSGEGSVLAGIPRGLPALLKAQRLGAKAARVGFDWPESGQIFGSVREEIAELERAAASGNADATREELGDVLFSIAMLARRLAVDPEEALERANLKFRERFERVERALRRRAVRPEDAGLELLDRLWEEAKAEEEPPHSEPGE